MQEKRQQHHVVQINDVIDLDVRQSEDSSLLNDHDGRNKTRSTLIESSLDDLDESTGDT